MTAAITIDDVKALSDACTFGSDFFSPYWTDIEGREVVSVYVAAHSETGIFVATKKYDNDGARFVRYGVYTIELAGAWAGHIEQVGPDFSDCDEAIAAARDSADAESRSGSNPP